ncbi:MAG: acyl-CoA thioesterase [Planctomycetota bacterium]
MTPTPLRWVDVDSEAVVNHAVYLSLMEQARFAYFEQLGLLGGGNIPFVMAEVSVRFLRPGRLRMDVVTAARVHRLGRTSFAMDFEVRAEGEVLATSSATLVYVDGGLRPVEIAPIARERIAAFEGIPTGSNGGAAPTD